ncbi:AcrR family transcriptional regulator [Sphingobium sp. B11D3B]|nr:MULTISPECIES: CerR family C-terminal domain-containing protein [unclassified Sphingobium]MCW2348764.1 AcrR family transcriptional regulator [Sphingobium sp. B12D2B]MCW2367891.1 AcrR family transcriptional regulator [Sphingobium sp. B11D3D]MCW2389568.1 AcrR family transcriptional regulator [Sphingobium sp. B11D3B]MCW2392455.1 AcrR family transcriptional regulator [Sphingobium sp. B11D3A]
MHEAVTRTRKKALATDIGAASVDTESPARSDLPLQIIEAALEQFGRFGFDGASTREIARASGTAMSSITYHFGSKEGLYLACADHIASVVGSIYAPLIAIIEKQPPQTPAQARTQMLALLETLARFLLSSRSATFAQFVAREQQHPTEAFTRLYDGLIGPLVETAILLSAVARPSLAEAERRPLILHIMGMALILRLGRACVVRTMQVPDLDSATGEALVASLLKSAETLLTEE